MVSNFGVFLKTIDDLERKRAPEESGDLSLSVLRILAEKPAQIKELLSRTSATYVRLLEVLKDLHELNMVTEEESGSFNLTDLGKENYRKVEKNG